MPRRRSRGLVQSNRGWTCKQTVNDTLTAGKDRHYMRHCCMVQSPLDGRSVGGAGAGSIPTCRANAQPVLAKREVCCLRGKYG